MAARQYVGVVLCRARRTVAVWPRMVLLEVRSMTEAEPLHAGSPTSDKSVGRARNTSRPAANILLVNQEMEWRARQGSNLQPLAPEADRRVPRTPTLTSGYQSTCCGRVLRGVGLSGAQVSKFIYIELARRTCKTVHFHQRG